MDNYNEENLFHFAMYERNFLRFMLDCIAQKYNSIVLNEEGGNGE